MTDNFVADRRDLSVVLDSPDLLNEPFDQAKTLKEATECYLRLSDLFHINRGSGSASDRRNEIIKILHLLVFPKDP